MKLRTLVLLVIVMVALAVGADTDPPDTPPWDEGLGTTDHSILAFRFQATFLKIDVADIDARLAPAESAQMARLASEGKGNKDQIKQAAAILLDADSIAFRFVFLREGGMDRFFKGTRSSFEGARKAGVINDEEYEAVWTEFQGLFAEVAQRGFLEGDQLIYRAENETVRVIYLGAEGDTLVDTTRSGPGWARAIKGSFLAEKVKFQKNLVGSLWKD